MTKPAFLKRVRIRNFKSIEFCDVTLEPFTILVGRNATGKSNFLDALAFLAEVVNARTVTDAIDARGGWDNVHSRFTDDATLEFEIEASFESMGLTWDAGYALHVERTEQQGYRVQFEQLVLSDNANEREVGFRQVGDKFVWIGEEHLENQPLHFPQVWGRAWLDSLWVSLIDGPPFARFRFNLGQIYRYNVAAPHIRSVQLSGNPLSALRADGSNLARSVSGLSAGDKEHIRRYLQLVVPSVQDFWYQQLGDNHATVRFQLTPTGAAKPAEFEALAMSDGTLRALAALVAVYQAPSGMRPSLVAIEEPEISLHPAALYALVSAFDEATMHTQVVITSHSPDILAADEVRPENVRVVEMIDGRTVIGPMDEANREVIEQGWNTLPGLERENQLHIDADDRERQRKLAASEGQQVPQ